ncbi:TetR/AcrR family transcriptional regulator [Microvirga thermotolerans]|uniref:TetR/AcrR family transcriptional regulator n=1 Tax=Microvirga thermotolerans TaxID=2651334 RepID=A0A5P9JZU8_9HYPH|nr:TetR/AcrR family transcriptional regulator [Microvirga thermotolerans]QFU17268.1 TetR/AcrR family transcriptional regulator [Microvirga thermotolerans]
MAADVSSKRKAVVEALMELASRRRWDEIEVGDIARAAHLSLSEFRELFPSKGAVLGAFSRMIDRQVLEGTTDDLAQEPARERVFDVMMRRFDALAPYKNAIRNIVNDLRFDPLALAALNREALNSQRFMLAAAGIPTEGALGTLKIQGAALVYANTLRAWLDDDDPAMAKTMARLDRELRRGEQVLERADDLRRLTAPLRAVGRALLEGRRPARSYTKRKDDGEASNPAAAI